MNLKRSPFAIQEKNQKDLDNAKDYPTFADLMREQNISNDDANTVHYRRDLDSIGQLILLTLRNLIRLALLDVKSK